MIYKYRIKLIVPIPLFQIYEQAWVDDGCPSSIDVVGSSKDKSYLAGVRCCSIDGTTCETTINCNTDKMSFSDAVLKCNENGRRICTKDELASRICCGTGGSCDFHENWTSPYSPWTEEPNMFCKQCSSFHDNFEEAKEACELEKNCDAVYDLFCDGIGKFCACNVFSIIRQTHPKGMDCIHRKPKTP